MKTEEAIAMHLLDVKRFTGPPVTAINYDQSRSKYDETIEIPEKLLEQSRLNTLKPMIKNFEFDSISQKYKQNTYRTNTYHLQKELYDFNNDTKDIDQPAMFTEYIRKFFE